ncbi:MAG: amidohydrolase family protein [Bryobacteraceae bacterium]
MRTPWGDIAVSDAHLHFFSHTFFSSLASQKQASLDEIGAALGWKLPPEDPRALAECWRVELDRNGLNRAALIASVPGDEASVAAAVAAFPNRFAGYFMLNPIAPDAEKRVRQALGEAGLRGVCLFPAMQAYSLHDPKVQPVFEAVAAHPGTVVFVHCGVLTVGVRKKLGLPSKFDMRYSNPLDLHAIALRHPEVNFVIPHFGAGMFRETLMLCDLCPNVHLDTSSGNSWIKYQTPQATLADVFRQALAAAGGKRLLFGSDSSFFPRGWNAEILEAQLQAMQEAGVGEYEARAILGGNFDRLFPRAA